MNTTNVLEHLVLFWHNLRLTEYFPDSTENSCISRLPVVNTFFFLNHICYILLSLYLGISCNLFWGLPSGASVEESVCQCRSYKRLGFYLWVGKIPWRNGTPVVLPGEFHGQKSLASYSPWGRKGSDTTERLTLLIFTVLAISLQDEFCQYH